MADVDREPVHIAPYDPRWPLLYEEERARIAAALGDLAVAIEHIGSTAVPGLGAKPVIDIMVGLRHLADGQQCIRPLERLGYEYRGEAGVPGRLFFRRFSEGVRTHHLHVVAQGSDFWEPNLLFRDYLRQHPEVAQEYYELKKRLAARFRMDRAEYLEGKKEFIESVVAKAKAAKKQGAP